MMGKKRLFALVTALVLATCCFALAACDKHKPGDPITYTVTYHANGGSFDGGASWHTEKVKSGEYATASETPRRDEYRFEGWGKTATDKTVIDLTKTPVTEDTTYHAIWEPLGGDNDPTLTGITVTYSGKAEYTEGDEFDYDSLKVVAKYDDKSEVTLKKDDYKLSEFDMTAGDKTVTVTYQGKTGTFSFKVKVKEEDDPTKPTLTGITVTKEPTKTEYIEGQTLDLTGLKVEAEYDDDTSVEVTDYTTTPANGAKLTKDVVEVSILYKGKPASFPITVAARTLIKLEITGTLDNPTQYVGAKLDVSGLTFTAKYDNGDEVELNYDDIEFTSSALNAEDILLSPGETVKITANYDGRSPQFSLTVVQPEKPTHTITFDKNNADFAEHITGMPSGVRTVEEGKGTTKPGDPKLTGFTFGGWYTTAACDNDDDKWNFDTDKMGTSDITLYAKWTAIEYDVTYTLNSSTNHSDNPLKYKATDGDIELKTPTRAHYKFLGWYTVGGNKVEKIGYERIVNMTAADIKLEAKWQAETYNITYELGGSDTTYKATLSETAVKTYTYGTARDLPGANSITIVKKDTDDEIPYKFLGWYWEDDETQKTVSTIPVGTYGDRKYIAKIEKAETWEFIYNCGVDHHDDGSTALTVHIVKGEKAEELDIATIRPGYTFGGWYISNTEFTEANKYNFNVAVSKDTEVFAKWTAIEYTIEYVGEGFTTTLPTKYTLDDGSINLTAPTLTAGYYFDGWYLNEDFDGAAVTSVGGWQFIEDEADENNIIKIYAKSSNKYTVAFDANGVTDAAMPDDIKVVYGEAVEEPDAPVHQDYGFLGWYKDEECKTAWDFENAINGTVVDADNRTFTLYAKWYEKPSDGVYVIGDFGGAEEWDKVFQGENALSYKATEVSYAVNGDAKEWRITGITLAVGDSFKLVDYTKANNKIDWNNHVINSINYRPEGMITVSLTKPTDGDYKVDTYTLDGDHTWTIEFGTNNEGNTYVTFTIDGYDIGWRDPHNEGNIPEHAEALDTNEWYLTGNFTDWFDKCDAWSTKSAVKDGNSYYFTKIYLKEYDSFKIMNKAGTKETWLGGTFEELGKSITLSTQGNNLLLSGIEDGYYNIVFTNTAKPALLIRKYVEPTIAIKQTHPVYEGYPITKDNLVVTADGSTVAAENYRILGVSDTTEIIAKHGENTIRIAYGGGIFEYTFTAEEIIITSIEVSKNPTKLWYFVGDTLSTTGLQIKVKYNYGEDTVETDLTKFNITATLVGKTTGDLFAANGVDVRVELKADSSKYTTYKVNVVNKLTSISVTTAPTKVTYWVGYKIDTTNMVVTAYFNGGTTLSQAVSLYTTTPDKNTALALSNTKITVNYEQRLPEGCGAALIKPTVSCETPITVNEPQITAIKIHGELDKSTYKVGDSNFSSSGLEFTATYENNDSKEISASILTFSFGEYANAAGMFIKAGANIPVVIKYGETVIATTDAETAAITVTVENLLTSIVVDDTGLQKPHAVGFVVGDTLTANGITVTAKYNEDIDGATVVTLPVTSGYTFSPALGTELETAGDVVVTVTYQGKTDTFTVTVVAKAMTALTVVATDGGELTPAEQFMGSTVNTEGLTFKAIYNNGDEVEVQPSAITFTSSPAFNDNGNFAVAGAATITATYNGFSCTFDVTVTNTTKYLVQFAVNLEGMTAVGMPSGKTVTHGDKVQRPTTNPTLKGYTFVNWYKDENCTTLWKFEGEENAEEVTGNRTIYAKWEAKTYNIDYYVGTTRTDIDTYTATNNVFGEKTLKTPANKEGHDFVGWCFSSDLSDTTPIKKMTYARIPTGDSTTITLYAKYEPKEYTVSFNLREGSGTVGTEAFADQIVKYGNKAIEPTETPTRKYYQFYMWYVGDYAEGTTTAYDFDTPVTGDITIKARWTAINYTVSYVLPDGATNGEGNPATFSFPDPDVTLADAAMAGNKFTGWTYKGNVVKNITNDMLPNSADGVIELTATFVPITYRTVTFYYNYDGATEPYKTVTDVEDGTAVEKPTDPTRKGWKFLNWYENAEGTGDPYSFSETVTANLPLFAKWERNTVKVTFNYNYQGGPQTVEATINQYDTAASVKPIDPTRTGYKFLGWYKNSAGTGDAYAFDEEVATALPLYAKWEQLTGVYAVIGTNDSRVMEDNSKESDYHEVEYMLAKIELKKNDTVKFTVNGVATKVYIDAGSHGVTIASGLQNSLTLTDDGTFSFYLYKTHVDDTDWTVYATYDEYDPSANETYYIVGNFKDNANSWGTVKAANVLINKTITRQFNEGDEIKLAMSSTGAAGGATDWNSGTDLGREAVTEGKGYIDSSSNNIKFLSGGEYTITLVYDSDGKKSIKITKKGGEEPVVAKQYIMIGDTKTELTAGKPNAANNEAEYYNIQFTLTEKTTISLLADDTTRKINQVLINGTEVLNNSGGVASYDLEAGKYNVHYKVYTSKWLTLDIVKEVELGDGDVTDVPSNAQAATITFADGTVTIYLKDTSGKWVTDLSKYCLYMWNDDNGYKADQYFGGWPSNTTIGNYDMSKLKAPKNSEATVAGAGFIILNNSSSVTKAWDGNLYGMDGGKTYVINLKTGDVDPIIPNIV